MTMIVTMTGNLIINITDVANIIRVITYLTTPVPVAARSKA